MLAESSGRAEGVTIAGVAVQARAFARTLAALNVDDVGAADAPALWAEFDRIERLASAAKTMLAAKVDESRVWKREGHKSAVDYFARNGGSSVSAARSMLETSRRVAELPETRAAMQRGELSGSQAEAIADAARVDSGSEAWLLEIAARTNLGELRDECLRTKFAHEPDVDARHARIHRRRAARHYTDAEGAWNFHARGTVDDGARFVAAIEPIIDELFHTARKAGAPEPREAYAFDALMRLANRPAGVSKRRTNPRFLALLRVDHAALVRGERTGEECCEIAGIGPVPVRVARDVLGESVLKLVITGGVDVANVVHLGRGPTAAQRVALAWHHPKCANEACSNRITQADHRDPWVTTKHTVYDELDLLCGHDHRLKTTRGWSLVAGRGRRAFVPPSDPRHPRNHPPP